MQEMPRKSDEAKEQDSGSQKVDFQHSSHAFAVIGLQRHMISRKYLRQRQLMTERIILIVRSLERMLDNSNRTQATRHSSTPGDTYVLDCLAAND